MDSLSPLLRQGLGTVAVGKNNVNAVGECLVVTHVLSGWVQYTGGSGCIFEAALTFPPVLWIRQGMIKATSVVLHHHICEGCAMSWPIDPRFNIFNDPPGMEGSRKKPANGLAARDGSGFHMRCGGGDGWRRGQMERPPPSYAEVRGSFLLVLFLLVFFTIIMPVVFRSIAKIPR